MLIENVALDKYTSLRTGGVAKYLYLPEDQEQLSRFLADNQQAIALLGLGSNFLLRDQGFDGVLIKLSNLNQLSLTGHSVQAQAGVTLAKLSRFVQDSGQYGAEFLAAIPGNVGGALAMNAGCFGSEIWDFVTQIETMDHQGRQHQRQVSDFSIGYRQVHSAVRDEFFVSATFDFSKAKADQQVKTLLKKRQDTQPTGLPSCGSVFKNPPGHYAAQLIEGAGLKGFCLGGACVSDKHANFIINQHQASATDVENLIKYIQQVVKSKFDIALETEVQIL